MDRFTRTRIPARYSRYRHNTLDLHVLENVCSSLALYLPPSSLLQLNIKLHWIHYGGQGRPAMPVSCHASMHEAGHGRAHSRSRRKPAGHGPRPLCLIFLCLQLSYNYCIYLDMTLIHALETNFSKDNYAQGLCTLVPFILDIVTGHSGVMLPLKKKVYTCNCMAHCGII